MAATAQQAHQMSFRRLMRKKAGCFSAFQGFGTPCTEVYVHHHHGGFKKDTNPHRFRTFGGFCELDGSRCRFVLPSTKKGPVNWRFSTLALICTWDSGDVQKIVHLTTETCMFVMLFHALKRQVAMPFSHRFVWPFVSFYGG